VAKGTNGKALPADVLDRWKFEVAEELGIRLDRGYNGEITAREAGRIGGHIGGNMVKVLIRHAEEALARGQGTT
jgi:small acid-soluble spore protein F (minor alpha/beta-type SASP)